MMLCISVDINTDFLYEIHFYMYELSTFVAPLTECFVCIIYIDFLLGNHLCTGNTESRKFEDRILIIGQRI